MYFPSSADWWWLISFFLSSSSRLAVFRIKCLLVNFVKNRKRLCWPLFLSCDFLKKEIPAQIFSCKFHKVFMGILQEHLRATASMFYIFFLNFGIKKLSKWFSSISETVAENSVFKSLGYRNHYQHIVT